MSGDVVDRVMSGGVVGHVMSGGMGMVGRDVWGHGRSLMSESVVGYDVWGCGRSCDVWVLTRPLDNLPSALSSRNCNPAHRQERYVVSK